MSAHAPTQRWTEPPGSDGRPLARISPPPAFESTAAWLEAQVREAAASTWLVRWAIVALVGAPVFAFLLVYIFTGLCADVGCGAVHQQILEMLSGSLLITLAGESAAFGTALPAAACFRAFRRAKLCRALVRLPGHQVQTALRALQHDSDADTRKIVEPLLRRLRPAAAREITPAEEPAGRGSEPAPGA